MANSMGAKAAVVCIDPDLIDKSDIMIVKPCSNGRVLEGCLKIMRPQVMLQLIGWGDSRDFDW